MSQHDERVKEILNMFSIHGRTFPVFGKGTQATISGCCGSRIFDADGVRGGVGPDLRSALDFQFSFVKARNYIFGIKDRTEEEVRGMFDDPKERVFIPIQNGKQNLVLVYKDA